jgi:hypothetical protein
MSKIEVLPIDLFVNTDTVYDQTKTSYIGNITTKTIAGKTVVGAPIVKYRNSVLSSEAITPVEIVITSNNRVFVIAAENVSLATIGLYNLSPANGELTYVGKINIQLPEPPSTTYAYRGFRVVDNGTTGWKIFLLVTANVAAHPGLYVADNLALADFVSVPPTIPTATAPGQKAVYRYDLPGPLVIADGTGLSLDVANNRAYLHRGVSATHSFVVFDYNATITTVGSLGQTANAFLFSTGNFPPLSGILLLTNSEEYTVPGTGPNAGQPCIFFCTTTTMYRGRVSEITNGATTWPSLEIANNLGVLNQEAGVVTTVRATYSDAIDRAILLTASSSFPTTVAVKRFEDNQRDLLCAIEAADNAENLVTDMYKFKFAAVPVGFDSRQGYLAAIAATTGQRGIYTASLDADDQYDLTHIISPVIDIQNKIVVRFTAGFVRPDLASPVCVYYRTSGFGSASGGWIMLSDDLDFGAISSPTGQIQIKIGFKIFQNESTNGLQLYSAGLVVFDKNSISDNWEYTHDDSSTGNPSIVAFRLKKAYSTAVPRLFFRATDLSDAQIVQDDTVNDAARFQYSTDGGVNWLSLGTIPNTVGTLLRYTFATALGVDIRPSIRED